MALKLVRTRRRPGYIEGWLIMSETENPPELSTEQLPTVKQDVRAGAVGNGQGQEQGWANYWRTVPAITWLIVVFALLVLVGGFTAMAVFGTGVTAGAITALVTAVLGVVGMHIGHVEGHQQASMQRLEDLAAGDTSSKVKAAS
jgi:hypothetical protein